ncbi:MULTISPECIES: cupin domain-containing protein [Gordonia]|jgi:quercetin dioxygenase-like cupin family protein|uniref:Cupin type-2 domain-containing protein n=1 Tax=Gordonia malaquae NBRC 108250 TaxID=1223542 RepID=M3UYR2_GORML|nr:cupin domain-containing protein [Gordonia malaquae]GAC81052.1 hypothetical protein GM1_026_00200 [Gordonia malaquae NBRC 108250]SEB74887.1 Cupin domain-containing protein [Gordonia malaquae]
MSDHFTYLDGLNAPGDAAGDRATVKRLHLSESETIVRIAFADGQEMREHVAVHPIVVMGQSGVIDFTVEGTTVQLRPGTAIRVDARVPHSLKAVEAGAVALVVVHGK